MRRSVKIDDTGQKVARRKGLRSQKEKLYTTTKNEAGFQQDVSFKVHIKVKSNLDMQRW